jgi:hypothetical protein
VSGWCTRYGSVDELVASRDNALVLVNGGDELTLEFAGAGVAGKPAGAVRDFFLLTSGWDKDADFHNAQAIGCNRFPGTEWMTSVTGGKNVLPSPR